MKAIVTETATVYRASGRRFLTKRAAYRRVARSIMYAHPRFECGCEEGVNFTCGNCLRDDQRPPRYRERLLRRYAHLLEIRDRKEKTK